VTSFTSRDEVLGYQRHYQCGKPAQYTILTSAHRKLLLGSRETENEIDCLIDNKVNLMLCGQSYVHLRPFIIKISCGMYFPLEHETGTWDRNGQTKLPNNAPFREGQKIGRTFVLTN